MDQNKILAKKIFFAQAVWFFVTILLVPFLLSYYSGESEKLVRVLTYVIITTGLQILTYKYVNGEISLLKKTFAWTLIVISFLFFLYELIIVIPNLHNQLDRKILKTLASALVIITGFLVGGITSGIFILKTKKKN